MKRRLYEYSQWLRVNESKGRRVILRAILDMKSSSQFIDDENVYYIVADTMEDAIRIYTDEVKGIMEYTNDEDPRSIESRLDLSKYRTPESIEDLGRDLEDLSAPDIHKGESREDYFNPDDYQRIGTSAKLFTSLDELSKSLERDIDHGEKLSRVEGPLFRGDDGDVVELLVDLAEVAPNTVFRYWDSKRGNMGATQIVVNPKIYSNFLASCEKRGVPVGESRLKNYRIISKIYNDPVLSRIANQIAAILGGGQMSVKELIENLIEGNQVSDFLKPSTEQISALLNIAKEEFTPEEHRGYTLLLNHRDKVI